MVIDGMKSAIILILSALLVTPGCSTRELGNSDFAKTLVFFVHAHGMEGQCWQGLISYLKRSGYPREYLKVIP